MTGHDGVCRAARCRSTGARACWRVVTLVVLAEAGGCRRGDEPSDTEKTATAPPSSSVTSSPGVAPPAPELVAAPDAEVMPEPRCRPDMVKVTPHDGPRYCVDRYEATLVEHATSRPLSPYYTPVRKWAVNAFDAWSKQRFEFGPPESQQVELPELPAWQRTVDVEPRALSKKALWPNGHVTGVLAATACSHAGKRLCTPAEWRTACGGEPGHRFPYGASYEAGACNVFREAHPAAVLHGDASIGHNDPRLNRVNFKGKPLLRKTGDTPSCASRWGDDAIFDMVGNLDEWVEHERGSFAGGFYARSTKDGCDWRSTAHPKSYADYSTGVRCCSALP